MTNASLVERLDGVKLTVVTMTTRRVVAVCEIEGAQERARAIMTMSREFGVADDIVATHLQTANDVLCERRLAMRSMTVYQDLDTGTLRVRVAVPVPGVRQLYELNTALAAKQLGRGLIPTSLFDVVFAA